MASPILKSLKVVDCASFIAAPAAATILSDFGAEVIKIEPVGQGDPYRVSSDRPGRPQSDYNYPWIIEARNKRSLALDLRQQDGQAILHKLIAQSDVFITNMPLAARGRLHIAYDDLRSLNGRLIYASFTGYGEVGADRDKPGFDLNAWWARSGLMDSVKSSGDAEPAMLAVGLGDHSAAVSLFAAIVMGLYRRQLTGEGGEVSTSLMANGAWANSYMIQARLCGATMPEPASRATAPNALSNHYRCRDGRWVMITLVDQANQWAELIDILGAPQLRDDPRFVDKARRVQNAHALVGALDALFDARDTSEWRERFSRSKLVFSVVSDLDDVAADQQMVDNRIVVPMADEAISTIDSPIFISGEHKVTPRMPPNVGQHSAEILREIGFDEHDIERFSAGGIIGKTN